MLAKDDNKLINIVNNQCTNIEHSFKQHAIKHCQTKHNCAADSTKPVWQNKQNCFNQMTLSTRHKKPDSIGFHDLTDFVSPPHNLGTLLPLSRKFIPQRQRAPIQKYSDFMERFNKDVRTKHIFRDIQSDPPRRYFQNEQWQPNPAPAKVEQALSSFNKSLISSFTSKFHNQPKATNLTRVEQNLLNAMKDHPELMVIGSDKNIGQYVIERRKHKKLV